MAATVYDLEIEQGATFGRVLTLKLNDNSPFPLFGYVGRSQIRSNAHASNVTGSFEVVIPSQLDATVEPGVIHLTMAATATAALPANRPLVYDLEIEGADGTVLRLLQGKVTVSAEITR